MLANAAVVRLRLQPADRCSGATTAPATLVVRRRRGAQHLRRAALLPRCAPTRDGRADADKAFYVSPFFAVDGRYEMTFTDPRRRRAATSRSRCAREDTSRVPGRRCAGTRDRRRRRSSPASLRHPLAGQRVTALIRLAGHPALAAPPARGPPARRRRCRKECSADDAKHWRSTSREPRRLGPVAGPRARAARTGRCTPRSPAASSCRVAPALAVRVALPDGRIDRRRRARRAADARPQRRRSSAGSAPTA